MVRTLILVGLFGVVCLPGFAGAAEFGAKNEKPQASAKPGGASVAQAVASLAKEYQAYQKDPKSARIREKSNYFVENPSPEATPEAILKALEGPVTGGREVEAYVKWQLLSGVRGAFPEELLKRALAVYKRAPAPVMGHPGLDRRTLDREGRRVRKEELGQVNKQMAEAIERFGEANDVILDYRNELFAHLPANKTDVMYAGLEDVALRASYGVNSQKFLESVAAGMRSWAVAEAKPGQSRVMADAVYRLREQYADAKPYTKLENDSKAGMKWTAGAAPLDGKKLDELAGFLANTTSTASGGGLKFKD